MNKRTASFIFAALLAAAPAANSAQGLPAETDKLPAPIQALFQAGQYRQSADALVAEAARNPKDAAMYFWLGRSLFEVRDFSKSISGLRRP